MARWNEYRVRFSGFWKQYRKSKMGLAGIIIILFFVIMALVAPFLPLPSPLLNNLAPPLSAPMWLMGLDPGGFTEINPMSNPYFTSDASSWTYEENLLGEGYITIDNSNFDENASGWTYSEAGGGFAVTDGLYRDSVGAPASEEGSGPGSYEIQFNDTTPGAAYGNTEAFLEYSYFFNASRYPAGYVDQYPYSVTVRYLYTVIFDCSSSELGDADAIFSLEMSNSSLAPVVIYSKTFQLVSGQDWRARDDEMTAQEITSTFTTNDTMTLSFHIKFRDPVPADTPVILFRFDDVQVTIGATFADTSDNYLMSGQFTAAEGNPGGSGAGSYEITFSNNDAEVHSIDCSAWITQSFTWDVYNLPEKAYIRYYYKVVVDGDPGDTIINVNQELYTENTGETIKVLKGKNINDDSPWTVSPGHPVNITEIVNSFGERGTLWPRWKVQVIDPTPEDTANFTIYFDECQLEILGSYYGALGSGEFGEDLLSQLTWGSRIAMLVGLTAAAIATFVGLIVGLISGYFGGIIDEILMRVTDFFLVIPGLPLMIVLAAILSPGWYNIVLVIALVGWTGTARLVRSQVLAERAKAYVEAARAIGGSDIYIIFRHILPNVTPLLFAQITLGVAGAILSEAGLSFLNLTDPNDVSWGRMLFHASNSGSYTRGCWWYVLFPGLCIVLVALSFTLVGYAVDEILNPRLRIRKG
jgi:peptide/nickel transport system permease protein